MMFSKRSCLIILGLPCVTINVLVHGFVPSHLIPSQKASLISSSSKICHPSTQHTRLFMAAMDPIRMPALSSTMKEGKIVSWLKEEGDEVSAGEAIMVVESDKADMDVEAFEDGFIAKILTGEGDTATVGDIVALVAESEADIDTVAAAGAGGETTTEASAEEASPAPTEGGSGYDCETTEIFMPALSSTMVEGKIVSWLKAVGDPVSAGEAIMVVESDKADMDVEAFEDGYLAAIITDEGETAEVGAPVGVIVENEADVAVVEAAGPLTAASPSAPAAPAPSTPKATAATKAAPATPKVATSGDRVVASPLAKKLASELGVDLSSVVGSGPNGRITGADIEKVAAGGGGTPPAKEATPEKPTWKPAEGVIAATPTARVLAKKAKLDLGSIKGTGQFGRVTADDVKIATGEKKPERKATAPGAPAPVELPEGIEPFDGMKKAVSNNMEATLSTPIFRVSREIQTDAFDELYKKVKPDGITVSALLAKAVAMAVEKFPIMNSSFDAKTPGTLYNPDINIAMAVAIDGGLITPTLKNANERNIIELGQNWRELVGKAKRGTLSPDEFQSGTFAISNLGMFGVSQFDAILPPGMGSILAIGGTQEKVVPDKNSILGLKVVKKMTVTLTCDHRQIYGADAALFLRELADIMENRINILTL